MGFINYERKVPQKYNDATFDLSGMNRLLELAGSPHRLPCAHIAGTKGKGSTSTILASILRAHGVRTGLYTSPHLLAWEERISVNGDWISKDQMRVLISRLRPALERLKLESRTASPTFFEALTALAWLHFRSESVGLAVMETGLGGRLDATNVSLPSACGITNIDYDHTGILGDTLEGIAREKAGIIKEGVALVSAPQAPEAEKAIRNRAADLGAPSWFVGKDIELFDVRTWRRGVGFSLRTPWFDLIDLYLPLLGRHQAVNAAIAISLAELLSQAGYFSIREELLRQGLLDSRLLGRAEVVSRRPLVVIDGAHNPAAVRALVRALRDSLSYRHMIVVVGMMKDKDAAALKELNHADRIIATAIDYPRALPAEELAQVARTHTAARVTHVADPKEALETALSWADPTDLVCVTGSFYLAGELRIFFP